MRLGTNAVLCWQGTFPQDVTSSNILHYAYFLLLQAGILAEMLVRNSLGLPLVLQPCKYLGTVLGLLCLRGRNPLATGYPIRP